jgi:signal transduction histidine kinase
MKKTCYILKVLFIAFTVYSLAVKNRFSYGEVITLLAITGINIYREKYNSAAYVTAAGLACVCAGVWFNPCFGALLALSAFDFAASSKPYLALTPVLCELYFFHASNELAGLLLITCVCCLFGYTLSLTIKRETEFKEAFDRERRLRYELEQVKARLLGASKEAARLAETQERNRIAREIHDSVGHRTSAVLIQLQAAYRLFDRDVGKAKETVGVCVEALAEAVELLRETVHNIRPEQRLGVEYIKSIIENFKFCPVSFKFEGDFHTLAPNVLEILGANILEALTNTQRHSNATLIEIVIDINDAYTRVYIKDNGSGCPSVKEGMGLGGMRERINNIGGTMSVTGDNGFMIVCVIPAQNGKGGFIA